MKYVDVVKYCLSLEGCERKVISESAFTFCVGEEIFAYFETGAPVQWRFTLRVTPEHYEDLHYPPRVRQAKDKPGEAYWLTIARVESFDPDLLVELINWSYAQVKNGLVASSC